MMARTSQTKTRVPDDEGTKSDYENDGGGEESE